MEVIDKIKQLYCLFLLKGKHQNIVNDKQISLETFIILD
jgi:hypothetical protein